MMNAMRRISWPSTLIAALALGCLPACSDDGSPTDEASADTLRGELKRVVISDPEHDASKFEYFLELADGRWLKLELAVDPDFEPNQQVVVDGDLVDDTVVVRTIDLVAPSTAGEVETVEEPLIAASPKRVAVILFNFSNDTTQPIDQNRARELVFSGTSSTNAYFKEQSFGIRSLVGVSNTIGDVFGWYTISASNSTCDYSTWGSSARTAAQNAGVNLSNYDHVVHYFPKAASCAFSGVGQMPGKYTWINGSGSQTMAHELGHNFGVHHASSYRCLDGSVPVAIGASCTQSEYGDPFDVMGSGYRHMNGYQKQKLGYLETTNLQTVTAPGTFAIAPLEQKATGLQVLRTQIPGTNRWYYVEYRQPFGFDSFSTTSPVVNGILIHGVTIPTSGVQQTRLIDNVPSTTSFTDAALGVGKTFTDSASQISITLTARTATSATVQMTVPQSLCGSGETAFNGHCYFATTSAQAFSSASSACTARGTGWRVASIESSAENSFVSGLIGSTEHWLSGVDSTTEGSFVWATGTTFWTGGPTGAAAGGSYVNWVSGEPNDSGDCMRMISGGQWRDIGCTSAYRALCEKG